MWLALDAANGAERWRLVYPAPGKLDYGNSPRAAPLVVDGVVYLLGAHGQLHAVRAATGAVLWKIDLVAAFASPRLEWGLTGSPLLVDGKLIVQPGGRSTSLAALDARTGKTVWTSPGAKPGHASLIVANLAGRTQIVGYDADSLGGWDPRDGARLWTVQPRAAGDFNVPTPLLLDDRRLFVCTENNGARIYRFDGEGRPRPEPESASDQLNPDSHTPVAANGRIYGVAGGLLCLDVDRGLSEAWFLADSALADYASLFVAERRILAYTQTAELVLYEDLGTAGRMVSRISLAERAQGVLSHPALVGDRLYARVDRTLYCVRLADGDVGGDGP